MLEKMKNLEFETSDIINMLIILDRFVKNTPEILIIEPFCDVLLEKSQKLYSDIDSFNTSIVHNFMNN